MQSLLHFGRSGLKLIRGEIWACFTGEKQCRVKTSAHLHLREHIAVQIGSSQEI